MCVGLYEQRSPTPEARPHLREVRAAAPKTNWISKYWIKGKTEG